MAGVSRRGDASLAALCPPKRLFRLVSDVAPGKSDVVQVALGQLGQLAPLKLSLSPDVERLVKLLEKP
jgi:hypothetical protein